MVMNRQLNPDKKIISAAFSYFADFAEMLRIDRKDKILLLIKRMAATEVHSSINVVPFNFNTFNEANTRKQIPSKLVDVNSRSSKSLESPLVKGCCIKGALKICRIFVNSLKSLQIYVCYPPKKQAPRWDCLLVLPTSLTKNTLCIY